MTRFVKTYFKINVDGKTVNILDSVCLYLIVSNIVKVSYFGNLSVVQVNQTNKPSRFHSFYSRYMLKNVTLHPKNLL